MKRLLSAGLALVLALGLTTTSATAASTPKPGASCSKAGITADLAGKRYTCIKKSKKLVWNSGVLIPVVPAGPTLIAGLTAVEYPGDFAGDPAWFASRKPAVTLNQIKSIELKLLAKASSFEYTGYLIPSVDGLWDFKFEASDDAFFWIGKAAETSPAVSSASISHLGTTKTVEKRFSQVLVKGERYAVRVQLGAPAGAVSYSFGAKPASDESFELGLQQNFKSVSPLAVSGISSDFPAVALPANQYPLFGASGVKTSESNLAKLLCQASDITPGDTPERSGFTKGLDSLSSTGQLRAFVGYVDYTNVPGTDDPVADSARFTEVYADFLKVQSNNRLAVNFTVAKAYAHIDATTSRYGMQKPGQGDSQLAMEDALAAFDPTVDFSQFDLVYILPSKGATELSYGKFFHKDLITDDGVVGHSIFVGNDWRDRADIWRWLAQNTGYLFGLPAPGDNTEAVITTNAIIWDVMADTSAKAPSHFGWNRWVQGWLTDDEVSCLDPSGKSTVLLTPANATVSGKKLAVVPISFTLEVVIESKRTDAFDEFDPTGDGVVVYLVDTQKSSAAGAISVLTRNKFLDSSGAPVIGTLRPGDSLQVNDFVITYRGVFEEGDLVTVEVVG